MTEMMPLSLRLSLRRGRLAMFVGLVTLGIVGVTLVLSHGAELERLDRQALSISQQEKLLDRYNSYSGTIASAVGRPVEVFVSIMVQVVVLWLMTDSVLAFTTRWRAKLTVLGLGASIGFLLTNGLNALNVQVIELPVKTVMSLSDLRVQNQSNASISSIVNMSFSENTPKNPTANTILRNLVLPRVAPIAQCPTKEVDISVDAVIYGMPQQQWMKHLLPEALAPTSSTKFDLLGKTPTTAPSKGKLPMKTTIAADLVLAAISSRNDYADFAKNLTFGLDEYRYRDLQQQYVSLTQETSSPSTTPRQLLAVPTTRLIGLLPVDERSTEEQDRAWFLDRVIPFIRNKSSIDWRGASLRRWEANLSHFQLTPSVWVDAITFESEVTLNDEFVVLRNGSRYYPTTLTSGSSSSMRILYPDNRTADAQIHSFAVCADGGVDGISIKFDLASGLNPPESGQCWNVSTNSMYVFSSGRYAVADAYLGQSKLFNWGDLDSASPKVIKDLRTVYSSTFARVSWNLQNLSELYGARCMDAEGGCLGLDANLSNTDQKQRLLVGATALPLDQLQPLPFNDEQEYASFQPQPFEIVSVRRPTGVKLRSTNEPRGGDSGPSYSHWLGDVLLHHNIREMVANDSFYPRCQKAVDSRVQNYVNNHVYIENTLQSTYTAAAFFLFQNGLVRDELPENAASTRSVALQLDQNVRQVRVWLSTPAANAYLTLAGCVVLIAALCAMLVRSHPIATEANERLRQVKVTTPHQIARVMLDDTTFPSMLLKRRVVHNGSEGDASEFEIEELLIQPVNAATEKEQSVDV